MDFEAAIDALEKDLRRLKIEYEQFFNGAVKIPPDQSRSRVTTRLQEIRSHYIRSPSLRFRLTNLEATFNQWSVLWNRRMRAHEEGTMVGGAPVRQIVSPPPPSSSPRRPAPPRPGAPSSGVEIGLGASDRAVRQLYDEVNRQRASGKASDYDEFRSFVMRQVATVRASTGCERVRLRVESRDGHLKLKARPI